MPRAVTVADKAAGKGSVARVCIDLTNVPGCQPTRQSKLTWRPVTMTGVPHVVAKAIQDLAQDHVDPQRWQTTDPIDRYAECPPPAHTATIGPPRQYGNVLRDSNAARTAHHGIRGMENHGAWCYVTAAVTLCVAGEVADVCSTIQPEWLTDTDKPVLAAVWACMLAMTSRSDWGRHHADHRSPALRLLTAVYADESGAGGSGPRAPQDALQFLRRLKSLCAKECKTREDRNRCPRTLLRASAEISIGDCSAEHALQNHRPTAGTLILVTVPRGVGDPGPTRSKCHRHVHFPSTVNGNGQQAGSLRLRAVLRHAGDGTGSGHYTADLLHDQTWVHVDDGDVNTTDEPSVPAGMHGGVIMGALYDSEPLPHAPHAAPHTAPVADLTEEWVAEYLAVMQTAVGASLHEAVMGTADGPRDQCAWPLRRIAQMHPTEARESALDIAAMRYHAEPQLEPVLHCLQNAALDAHTRSRPALRPPAAQPQPATRPSPMRRRRTSVHKHPLGPRLQLKNKQTRGGTRYPLNGSDRQTQKSHEANPPTPRPWPHGSTTTPT